MVALALALALGCTPKDDEAEEPSTTSTLTTTDLTGGELPTTEEPPSTEVMGSEMGTEAMGTEGVDERAPSSGWPPAVLGSIGAAAPAAPAAELACPDRSYDEVSGTGFSALQQGCDITEPEYRRVTLEEPRAELCREFCAQERKCKAFAYTRPGTYGATKAMCWFKAKRGTFMPHANATAAVRAPR